MGTDKTGLEVLPKMKTQGVKSKVKALTLNSSPSWNVIKACTGGMCHPAGLQVEPSPAEPPWMVMRRLQGITVNLRLEKKIAVGSKILCTLAGSGTQG